MSVVQTLPPFVTPHLFLHTAVFEFGRIEGGSSGITDRTYKKVFAQLELSNEDIAEAFKKIVLLSSSVNPRSKALTKTSAISCLVFSGFKNLVITLPPLH